MEDSAPDGSVHFAASIIACVGSFIETFRGLGFGHCLADGCVGQVQHLEIVQQLVKLIPELALQVLDILVTRIKMLEFLQFILE